jgi:hypothetical protein
LRGSLRKQRYPLCVAPGWCPRRSCLSSPSACGGSCRVTRQRAQRRSDSLVSIRSMRYRGKAMAVWTHVAFDGRVLAVRLDGSIDWCLSRAGAASGCGHPRSVRTYRQLCGALGRRHRSICWIQRRSRRIRDGLVRWCAGWAQVGDGRPWRRHPDVLLVPCWHLRGCRPVDTCRRSRWFGGRSRWEKRVPPVTSQGVHVPRPTRVRSMLASAGGSVVAGGGPSWVSCAS